MAEFHNSILKFMGTFIDHHCGTDIFISMYVLSLGLVTKLMLALLAYVCT